MSTSPLAVALALATLVAVAMPAPASAASLRLKCERRASPARSSISVDGRNVSPNALYTARAISGSHTANTGPKTAIGDEVEFDFDSDPGDIRKGETAISSSFIVGNSVRAMIFDSMGHAVAGPTTVACSVK